MNNKMNVLLSDLVVFYHKLQSYHWYVKGSTFFQVHAKLEEYYDGVLEQIDDVAETSLMAGIQPISTLHSFLENSGIEEAKGEYIEVKDVFESVLKDFQYLLDEIKEIKELADEENNYLISAKADGWMEPYYKGIWMISQSLK